MLREDNFEYKAKEILLNALEGYELKYLNDCDEFQEEIWEQCIACEIGRSFMVELNNYSGDNTYLEAMKELKEKQD